MLDATVTRQTRLARGTRTERGTNPAPAAIEEREFRHGLLLLAFFAEDILAAILDALALVGLRLAPAADLGGNLADLLLVDAADLDRGVVGSLDVDAFRPGEIDIVAIAELQLQVPALGLRTLADAGDLQHLREARGDARHQVLHVGALHAPRGAVALRVDQRSDADFAFADLILHEIVEQLHRKGPFGSLYGQGLALDGGRDARGHRDRLFTDARHWDPAR